MTERDPEPVRPISTEYHVDQIQSQAAAAPQVERLVNNSPAPAEGNGHEVPRKRGKSRPSTGAATDAKKAGTPTEPPLPQISLDGVVFSKYGRLTKVGGLAESYFRLTESLLYIQKKKGDKHPVKCIDLAKASEVKPAGGPNFNLVMKDGTTYEFRAQNPDDYKKWGKALSDSIKHIANRDNKRKIVDVYFMDGSHISVVVHRFGTTAEDLWWCVCEALDLPKDVRDCFFVWITGGQLDYLLCNEDIAMETITTWPQIEAKFAEKGIAGAPRFVFKTTPVLDLKTERNIKNNKAIHLFYTQALQNVVQNYYTIDMPLAIQLAALQAQIRWGDYDPAKMAGNYISKYLNKYVPEQVTRRNKKSNIEWDQIVAREHQKLRGKTLMICELLFLQQIRSLPYYGCTFFTGKNKDRNADSGYFAQKDEGHMVIGINMEGIHTFYKDNYIASFPWKSIAHWEVEQEQFFYFTSDTIDSKGVESRYLVQSKEAPLMREMINDIVFELKRKQKQVRTIRKQQTQILQDLGVSSSNPQLGSALTTSATHSVRKHKSKPKAQ